MEDYFLTLPAHVQGNLDFDAIPASTHPNLISLGSDDLVIWRNSATGESGEKELVQDHGFTQVALHPKGDYFIAGGFSKKIYEFQLSQFETK